MIRLLLLRHAKSSWDSPDATDFERPLNSRGMKTAPFMGQYMADHALIPDKILCSTARRTRDTLAGLLPAFPNDHTIHLLQRLYDSPERNYIDPIKVYGQAAKTILLIGHCPTIQQTAIDLIGNGNPDLKDEIVAHYPTAALAVIDFDREAWTDIQMHSGRVVAFFRPRDLQLVADNS